MPERLSPMDLTVFGVGSAVVSVALVGLTGGGFGHTFLPELAGLFFLVTLLSFFATLTALVLALNGALLLLEDGPMGLPRLTVDRIVVLAAGALQVVAMWLFTVRAPEMEAAAIAMFLGAPVLIVIVAVRLLSRWHWRLPFMVDS